MPVLRRLAAEARSLKSLVSAVVAHSRRRRANLALSYWNERLLRDVGLTRADYLACLSSPWDSPDEFRHVHVVVGHLPPVVRPAREIDKLAA
jgi:uncharacterized protein YjiS (DUF1127 family)